MESTLKGKYGDRAVSEALRRLGNPQAKAITGKNLAALITYTKEAAGHAQKMVGMAQKDPSKHLNLYLKPGKQSGYEIGFGLASIRTWLRDSGYPDLGLLMKHNGSEEGKTIFEKLMAAAKKGQETTDLSPDELKEFQEILSDITCEADVGYELSRYCENGSMNLPQLENMLGKKGLPDLSTLLAKSDSRELREAFGERFMEVDDRSLENFKEKCREKYEQSIGSVFQDGSLDISRIERKLAHDGLPNLSTIIAKSSSKQLKDAFEPYLKGKIDKIEIKADLLNLLKKECGFHYKESMGVFLSECCKEGTLNLSQLEGKLTHDGLPTHFNFNTSGYSPVKVKVDSYILNLLNRECVRRHNWSIPGYSNVAGQNLQRVDSTSFLGGVGKEDADTSCLGKNVQRFEQFLRDHGCLLPKAGYEKATDAQKELREALESYRKEGKCPADFRHKLMVFLCEQYGRGKLKKIDVYRNERFDVLVKDSSVSQTKKLELRWSNRQSVEDTLLAFESRITRKGYPPLADICQMVPKVGELIERFKTAKQLNTQEISQLQREFNRFAKGFQRKGYAELETVIADGLSFLPDGSTREKRIANELSLLNQELQRKGYPEISMMPPRIRGILEEYKQTGSLDEKQKIRLQKSLDEIMHSSFTSTDSVSGSKVNLRDLKPGDIVIQRTTGILTDRPGFGSLKFGPSTLHDMPAKYGQFFARGGGDYRDFHVLLIKDVLPNGRVTLAHVNSSIETGEFTADANTFLPQLVFRPKFEGLAQAVQRTTDEAVEQGAGRIFYDRKLAQKSVVSRIPILSRIAPKAADQEDLKGRSFFCSHFASLVLREAMSSVGISTEGIFARKASQTSPRELEAQLDGADRYFQRLGEIDS
ncbi:MAG: hypothetical protein LBR62_00525 [Puniceicoccales bacterium]|nr:hypothetical protein [Puniceicoccales bacterium]